MLGLSTGGKWQVIHSVDFLREFWKFKLNWKSRTKFTNLTSKDACYSDFIGSNFQSLLGGISKAGPHLQSRARYSCTTSLSSISIRCKLSCQTNYSNGFNVCHLFWDSKFYNSLIHVLTPVDNSTLSTAQSRNWTRLNDLLEPGNPDHPSCCDSDFNVMNKFITYDLTKLQAVSFNFQDRYLLWLWTVYRGRSCNTIAVQTIIIDCIFLDTFYFCQMEH